MDAHLVDLAARAADVATRALPALADAAVKGTVILAAAALATRLLRRSGAATRHLIWSTAVVAVLALPALSLVAPPWTFPVALARLPIPQLPATSADRATIAEPIAAPGPGARHARAAAADSVAARPPAAAARAMAAEGTISGVARPTEPVAAPASRLSPLGWLALVWALGALVVLARLALGTLGLARLVRRATPADDASWVMLLQRLARQLGIRRPVTLLVGRTGTVPVTWGVVYPIVLLPADADTWSEDRRRAVLLHELAHVERFDALTHVLSQLTLAVFWFHPLVWTAARRLRAERERACDDLVLAVGTRATAYADDLLELVQTLGEASPAVAALAMARRSEFEGRLLAILDPAVPRARTTRGTAAGALAVAVLAVVPLAGARAVLRAEPAPMAHAPSPHQPLALRDAAGQTAGDAALRRVASRLEAPGRRPAADGARLDDSRGASGAALGGVVAAGKGACAPRAGKHVAIDESGARSHTRIADGRRCIEVTIDGKTVELSADDSQVVALAPNGSLILTETRGDVTREAVIRERGGQIGTQFFLNGAPVTSGARIAEAYGWLHRTLRVVAREAGLGVPARVARLRREGGVDAVLREIPHVASDGVKRAWFAALLDTGPLSADELRRAALTASRSIASDGDKASVLREIARRGGGDPAVGMAVVSASNTIASDGDRRNVLDRATDGGRASGAVLTYAAQSAKGLASDGDKASILRTLASRAADQPALRAAIADAATTVASDGDRASVLVALLAVTADDSTLVLALRSARGISSSGDRRRVAVAALPRTRLESAAARDAFFALVDGISTDGDKAAVLLAVARRKELPPPALAAALRVTSRVSSDGDKAGVLFEVTTRPAALEDSTVRSAFFDALRTVSSGGDYRRVMERVAR